MLHLKLLFYIKMLTALMFLQQFMQINSHQLGAYILLETMYSRLKQAVL
ncbi:putative structure protein 2e [SARS coronavirus ZJ0301]|uniref:Putative structure protein 2e n=2 Tax=Severe acute respiratory syndrome coronavirus TaxID=694009 RepID=Q3S2C8_SARS|nr:putative structure protein 2e [SARS coronavirus ZJ01]ABA02264.1 putative structure protein 2e [SARS coronavirus ZJ0301]